MVATYTVFGSHVMLHNVVSYLVHAGYSHVVVIFDVYVFSQPNSVYVVGHGLCINIDWLRT